MAMRDGAGTPLDPANLWGKPDPRKSAQVQIEEKEEKNVSGIDADLENDEIDVDAELDADAKLEAELGDEAEEADYENEFDPEEGDEDEVDDEDDADAELEDTESYVAPETDVAETAESTSDEADDDESPAVVSKTAATSSRKREMTDKKTSLSDHIRSEIARRQEAGEELRGKDIVASLASRRIKVSPAQVSQILKKEGLSSGTRGRKPKAAATAADGERSRSALKTKPKQPAKKPMAKPKGPIQFAPKARPAAEADGFHVPLEQLQAAETFVKSCGGSFKTAESILTAAAQLSQSFGK